MGKIKDLKSQTFGKITVLSYSHIEKSNAYWYSRCDCGNTLIVKGCNLRSGNTKTCGCGKVNNIIKHGKCNTSTYTVWRNMIERCTNPNNANYKNYGGRGITVCDRWVNSFQDFIEDVGEKPFNKSIDRIDNEKGYFPDNVRWATLSQQANNKRKRKDTTSVYRGVHLAAGKWVARVGYQGKTLYLGRYTSEIEAARVFDAKVIELGLPIVLNFFR